MDPRQTVEAAARANAVATVRRDRIGVLDDIPMMRSDNVGYAIAQIAMRWIGRKPKQERTEQPRPRLMSAPVSHVYNDK
jgi:hypothetical protein